MNSNRSMMLVCICTACMCIVGCVGKFQEPQRIKTFTSYRSGEVYTVTPGSEMLVIECRSALPYFRALFEYKPPPIEVPTVSGAQNIEMSQLPTQDRWFVVKPLVLMGGYVIANSSYSSEFGIHVTPTGLIDSGWVKLSDGKIPRQGEWTKKRLFDSAGDLPTELYFKAELLYLGMSQNTVKILYREFTGDLMARPAYYYDLMYDMSESKKIVFKTIEMEVVEATNSSITFRIVTDGGLPWMPCDAVN